jgi:hypothetical protein
MQYIIDNVVRFTMCDAYVDQGRYIGEDPVGYKCCQYATNKYWGVPGLCLDLCNDCLVMIRTEPERIKFILPK